MSKNVSSYFLSSLSHEIRTPLNGIIGYNQLLLRTHLSSIQKRYVIGMNECSIQLMELINDILDYSKLTIGQMTVKPTSFTIQEVIDIIKNTLSGRILEKNHTIHYVVSRNVPMYIVADKQKIIQILINLVSNAIKFTPVKGFISLHVSPQTTNVMQFTVKDNGIGIAPEDQTKIFEPFYRVENDSLCINGSGLGLTISKELVNLMKGEISVVSSLNKGSTFTFSITCSSQDEIGTETSKSIQRLKGKYVLIVEKDLDCRIKIGDIFFEWRMKPIVCASVKEAIKMITDGRYDFSIGIITIDTHNDDSIKLAQIIKQHNPDLPLISVSSDKYVNTSYFISALYKPIETDQLLNRIKQILLNDNKSIYIDNDIEETFNIEKERKECSKNTKILIVDDIENNLNILEGFLISLGYKHIRTATNGKLALNSIDKDKPDIILLDLKMPVMDGFKVIEYLNKNKIKIPIAVITASVDNCDRKKCKKLGIKFFIVKPITINQINDTLNCMI